MKWIKKILKIFFIVILSVILLNIILFVVFSFPGVQKRAADIAISKLKPKLNTEVSIDKIRIKFFNAVELGGLYIEDQKTDTLAYLGEVSAGINIRNLLHNKLSLRAVRLKNFTVNVNKDSTNSDFNFQFIIDAFASNDTLPKPEKKPLDIAINDIKISNGTLRYDIFSAPETPGKFNPNHFFVSDFNLTADVPSLDMERLRAEISDLSFYENHAGIDIEKLEGQFRSKKTNLWTEKLNLIFNNSSVAIKKAAYDTKNKDFEANLKSEQIDPADVSIFTDMIAHLDQMIALEVEASGKIPQAKISDFILKYGDDTNIIVKGEISDFSKFETADIDLSVDQLKTTVKDLENFIRIGSEDFQNMQQLEALKKIDAKLSAKGKLSDFKFTTLVKTVPGDVSFNGKGSIRNEFSDMAYSGKLQAQNLKLAEILGESTGVDNLYISTDAGVEIKKEQPIKAFADGVINSVKYKDFTYQNLYIDGIYSGNDIKAKVNTDTPENKFDLNADLTFGEHMKFDVNAVIDRLFLTPLITVEQWENPYLVAKIDAHLAGNNIDELVGEVLVDSTSLFDEKFIYNPGPVFLEALSPETEGEKKIRIYSSVLDGEISGDYHFSSIGSELSQLLHQHLPSVIKEQPESAGGEKNQFNFNFTLKNTENLSFAMSLPLINVDPAVIEGTVDMVDSENIQINGRIPRVMMGQNDIRETKIQLAIQQSGLNLDADTYLLQDNGHINAHLNTVGRNDSVNNILSFNISTNVAQSDGKIDVSLGFLRDASDELNANIFFNSSDILFNDKTIHVIPSTIVYEKEKITVKDFELREEQMLLLGIDGVASKVREDSVSVFFNNTDLETILAAFKVANLKGSINGGVVVHQALADPIIHTDNFRIENIRTPSDTLGTLAIEGDWDMIKNGLTVDAALRNRGQNYLTINGFVPMDNSDGMDVKLNMDRLPLSVVQPFAESAFSQLSGTVNSKIDVTGKLDAPKTTGWIGIDQGVMTVAYTNVTYKISDTINISPETIGLNNLIITDNNNHEAKINVLLSHSNFDGMNYTVKVNLDDFLLLNNERSTDMIAYGTLKLSGDIDITGSSSGIYGNVELRNDSRSKIVVEMPQTAQATTYSGIIYINTPQQTDSLAFLRRNEQDGRTVNTRLQSDMPINIQGLINVNPMFEAGVEINPATGDRLEIKGTSELRFTFDSQSTPSVRLYGDYVAEDGKFKYNFQGLKTIDFNLEEGSTVSLVGDPMSTQFNISAYHQVNADLSKLSPVFASELATPRLPVNATLDISGNLNRMSLDYDIELPEAPNETKQRLNSIISTEEQKNKQFAALILTGGFMPAEGSVSMGSNDNVAASFAIGQISKGLDALLAGALNDNWSISTNLESTDGTFDNMRMNVDVSTRLFDDRLRITTNLSYGDNSTLASQQAFMGEFELEYDINNWLMMRAYNRANQRFSKRAPTTQGVGVVVTRNSKRFKDLFKFSFRKRNENR